MRKLLLSPAFLSLAVFAPIFFACNEIAEPLPDNRIGEAISANQPLVQGEEVTQLLSVARLQAADAGSYRVMFFENPQIFYCSDAAMLELLQQAYYEKQTLQVKYNPWISRLISVKEADAVVLSKTAPKALSQMPGISSSIDLDDLSAEAIDEFPSIAPINTTNPDLNNVIPDMATAMAIFNYFTQQCCALGGPYDIDQCISFQYCPDGCYARAHKMCYLLNTKYKYSTHKIFSFANDGSDRLSVRAQKWGGCCINWWYHVAPLVNVQTPTGVKAFVYDPAMFNQPVLLSTWLHWQENPDCISWGTANVSMINLQPTESYSPASWDGLSFDTDPLFSSTNATMSGYSGLLSCP